MSKVLFIDVDGTLINYSAITPNSAKLAVDKARENGNKVVICTGCSKYEIGKRDIPEVDGMIGANGAYVEYDNRIILHESLDVDTVKEVVDWCNKKQLGFYLESNAGMFCNDFMLKQGPDIFAKYALAKGKSASSATVFMKDLTLLNTEKLYRDDVDKISYILSSYDDYLELKEKFPAYTHGTWGGKGQDALFGDISLRDISKKKAVELVLSYLKLYKEDAIGFGDAKVDLKMFEACHYNVAMGNGSDEIKEAADYITTDVDDDGLYKAFEHLKLI